MGYPSHISLIWNSIKDWKVVYTNAPILQCDRYINTVHLRKLNCDINIYGDLQDNCCNISKKGGCKRIHAISLLKSNIQKAVRLGRIDEALISSLNLIEVDFMSFIRRAIIICIEDVGIPSTLPLMVWLLMTYPNIEITNEIIKILLLTIYGVCVYNTKHYPDTSDDILDYTKYDYSDAIINSLLIASEYGGFKGDVSLFNRFINSTMRIIIPIKYKNIILTRSITKRDIIPSAIDFHCYPNILDEISKKTNLDRDTVKSLIWKNSSSINFRTTHKIVDEKTWKNVTKNLNIVRNNIIQKIYIT
jgi:hypothetical protein